MLGRGTALAASKLGLWGRAEAKPLMAETARRTLRILKDEFGGDEVSWEWML